MKSSRVVTWGVRLCSMLLLLALGGAASFGSGKGSLEKLHPVLDRESPLEQPPASSHQLLVCFKTNVSNLRKTAILNPWAKDLRFFHKPRRGDIRALTAPGSPSVYDQWVLVNIATGHQITNVQSRLAKSAEVLYSEPNYRISIVPAKTTAPRVATNANVSSFPNDFDFANLWGLNNTGQTGGKEHADIDILDAWKLSTGDKKVIVAVIDTGIDYYHPDLAANVWVNPRETGRNGIDDDRNGYIDDVHGYDFVSHDGDPMDDNSHGSHVSGTIGAIANNKIGIAGICWNVSLMALKAFDETGNGDTLSVVEAIHYAIENGAQIINASWGLDTPSKVLQDAVIEAHNAGLLFIAAAGNNHNNKPFFPASYPEVIAVAATDANDQRAVFSNYGSYVDVAAPGDNIYSTIQNASYDFYNGTSMATPHVVGVAALIRSWHPEFSNVQVENILRNSVDWINTDQPLGGGRINAYKALLVDKPLPLAQLTVPPLLAGAFQITGTAKGESFASYSVTYGSGHNPTNWIEIGSGTFPVDNNVLVKSLTTDGLADGDYTFKLTVKNDNGQSAESLAYGSVKNVEISFPLSNDILRAGDPITIQGSAFGEGRTYLLQWGYGQEPTNWFDTGITIPPVNPGESLGSILGTWDTRAVGTNKFCTLRLRSQSPSGKQDDFAAYSIYFDGHLKPGWPKYLPFTGEYPAEDWRQITVADLNHDGKQEMLIVDHGNSDGVHARLLAYGSDGTLLWSRDLGVGPPFSDIPVAGDVDGDGYPEIFVDIGDQLFGFKRDGTPLGGNWPVKLEATNLGKVLADLDGNGTLELIAYAQEPALISGQMMRQLLVFDKDGNRLRRWNLPSCDSSEDVPKMFPAVANLDDNPDLEIVAVSGCDSVAMYDMKNPNGPVWIARTDGTIVSSPVIGDVDHDGRNEIVIGATGSPGGVYMFDRQGQTYPGWPVLTDESFTSVASLADFEGGGQLAISIPSSSSEKLHLLHADGFEPRGWPVGPLIKSTAQSSTVIGDINSDGELDVIFASPGYFSLALSFNDPGYIGGVKAWKFSGEPIDLNPGGGFPDIFMESRAGEWHKSSPVTLVDIDGDGVLDMVGASIEDRTYVPSGQTSISKNRSSLYAWDLGVRVPAANLPWPAFMHDSRHSGFLPSPPPQLYPPVWSAIPNQIVAPGNSFFPITLDEYVHDPDTPIEKISWLIFGNTNLTVSIDRHRVVRISPANPNWTGEEHLIFIARDDTGLTATNTAVFQVVAGYIPPAVVSDSVSTLENMPVEIDALANDTDPGGHALFIANVSRPALGSARLTNKGTILYTPRKYLNGIDTFTYTVTDRNGGFAMGTVTILIIPVNNPPEATPDRVITLEDTPVTMNVLTNDFDPENDLFWLINFTQPDHGTVMTNTAGLIVYTPKSGWFGIETFNYTIGDAQGSNATATVTVMVKHVNHPPVVSDSTYSINKNAPLNYVFDGHDADGDVLTFNVVKSPDHGELWAYPTVATYYPAKGFVGTDTFTYTANDGKVDSALATVTIVVRNQNNPPTAESQNLTTRTNKSLAIVLAGVDLDDDPLTFQITDQPLHGSLSGSGSNYVYTPQGGFLGSDSFYFTASDGMTSGPPTIINLKVTDQNSAPSAVDFFLKVKMNAATNITLLASDPENDPLTYRIVTFPGNGTISGTNSPVSYVPKTNYNGPDRFTFSVSDGQFESNTGTVTLAVAPLNNPPVAENQIINVRTNQPLAFSLKVRDPEGDALECPILKGPQNGILTGEGTNLVYTPKPDFRGGDSFTYKAWDGQTYGNKGIVTVNVAAVPVTIPQFKSISLTGGHVAFQLKVEPGRRLDLESSTNLVDWKNILSTQNGGSDFTFTDTNNVSASGARFYRALQF